MRVSTLLVCLTLTASATIAAQESETISRETLASKIRGAWAGQMIGVTVGWPSEFRALAKQYTDPIEWNPDKIYESLDQDDLYVEMTFCQVLDDEGIDAPASSFGKAFADTGYKLWHANFKARQNLLVGLEPPLSGHPEHNIHADDIDFQIESDFIGLMCPGMPNTAVEFADRIGHVMNYGDGVYGGMMMAAMYSTAFFEDDIAAVVDAGLAVIPEETEFYRALRFAVAQYEKHPDDLDAAWAAYEETWANTDACSHGALHAFDIDAKTNAAYVVFGLLYGEGNITRTIEASIRCGQDSDCNPASAAGILGAMQGYDSLPEAWRTALEAIADRKFSYTDYSFNSICESSLRLAEKVIAKQGGAVAEDMFTVRLESPKPAAVEQWSQDNPVERIGPYDDAITYTGTWKDVDGGRVTEEAGATAELRFTGTGAIVTGRYADECGIVEVLVDGKPLREVNLYYPFSTYNQAPFHGEAIAHVFGLERGDHTITVVATGRKDNRATGHKAYIDWAVLYDGPETAGAN